MKTQVSATTQHLCDYKCIPVQCTTTLNSVKFVSQRVPYKSAKICAVVGNIRT